ncbi:DUF4386 domain-containing protein [Actinoplanes sp. RD1]|uniref:DUF4386 domain-containing protein n=1 Tax=Actinoplanes sp. RD1 TaxID=3064538 RepID=UPI0027419A6A|nr:DUF4386 domain-containing protein [Actinoplanes sp. RD1]
MKDSQRQRALIAGVFYLLTFVSVPTLPLYNALHDGAAAGTGVVFGAVLETVVALACIGTAVALHPTLRQRAEGRALGFVTARVVEATLVLAGVATLLTLAELHRSGHDPDSRPWVALYDSLFVIGQGLIPAVNAILLGSVLYQFRLVPRWLPALGLTGAPLLVAADLGILFGAWDRFSPVVALASLPIALWELSLGIYLIAKGPRRGPAHL